jgi:hypothetical protein
MKKRHAYYFVFLIFFVYIVYRIIVPPKLDDALSNNLVNLSVNVISGLILIGLVEFLYNVKRIRLWFTSKFVYGRQNVRYSIAYLFRIEAKGKFLLVKSRHRSYFQPVGGAFQTLPGSEKILDRLNVESDKLIDTSHGVAKKDLRGYVKGWNLVSLLDWFKAREDREVSPWREFCEELLEPKILPRDKFRWISYKYKGTIQTPIFTLNSGGPGIFVYEIYDLLPNSSQQAALEELCDQGDTDKYVWVSNYLIQRLGHDENNKQQVYDLGPHTKWAANLKYSKE